MSEDGMDIISYVLIVGFVIIIEWLREKHRKKMTLVYNVTYITTLERTLYLCKYVLEILNSLKKDTLTSKEILDKLKENGLEQLVEKYDFCFCNNTYFSFKPTDDIFVFIDTFSQTIQEIEKELSLYWTGEKTPFISFLSFTPSPLSYDTRFLPPETIEEISRVFKDKD